MSVFQNRDIKVTMETDDGLVFTGRCLMAEVTISNDPVEVNTWGQHTPIFYPGNITWDISLQGTGSPTWNRGRDLAPGIMARFLPQEWACEYCGQANSIKLSQYQECGWYRGLIADVVQEAGVWRVKK